LDLNKGGVKDNFSFKASFKALNLNKRDVKDDFSFKANSGF
jgi:hypothetical protein